MKITLKRTIVLVLVLCMAAGLLVAFTACNNQKDPDKLYVGLECAYSPFNYTQIDSTNGAVQIKNTNYKNVNGQYANGYDVMIAKRIAEELGKELVIVKCEWNGLIPALNAGTIDMVIAGMSPTAERLEQIDFSDPYYQSNLVIVVNKNSQYASATSLSDFNGAKIVAQKGTFHDNALQSQGPSNGIIPQTPMADFPAMINALNVGAVDGYIAEEPGAIENCASNSNFKYVRLLNNSTGFAATDADTAIAVGVKKNSSLTAQINAALQKISATEREQMMNTAIALSSGTNISE
ncbi:MAG: transporter substrate-binding domain-containing protein [Bacteroides sp.]|nr:transporter substrate-binding domain-containing protein [Bacillota bacterium]MCM1394341.1 transporter substrate-binding domain-containing protein [[Eubacterium] siraeum]MCM1456103.1 transporter substrate-binding domain-containing protein [Bacteroides sp.]